MEVHQWPLPLQTDHWPPLGDPDIHYFGQVAAQNDCLHRHTFTSRYLVFTDLDEFIIPRRVANWSELLRDREAAHYALKRNKTSGKNISFFLFKCVFFRKEWMQPAVNFSGSSLAEEFRSVVLRHPVRELKTFPFGERSKFIAVSGEVEQGGIHVPRDYRGVQDGVEEDVAFLHHYRSWEKPNDTQEVKIDSKVIDVFGERLVAKLTDAWQGLQGVPMDVDLTIYERL